jgi:hypothetical protein
VKKRIGLVITLSLAMLAVIAASGVPTQSRPDLDSRLREFGMPAGAELVAAQQGGDGRLMTVYYRDGAGQVHMLGNVAPLETPSSGG